jgi:hypothetical protein
MIGILQDSLQSIEQSITLDQQLLLLMHHTMPILHFISQPTFLVNIEIQRNIISMLIEKDKRLNL